MGKRSNGFDKDPERARLAGQKSSNALPPELKEARLENAKKVEGLLYKYTATPKEQLQELLKDGSLPSIDHIIIKIISKAIEDGDHHRLNFLLDRMIGRVIDKMQLDARVVTEQKTLHEQIMEVIEIKKDEPE